MACQVFPNWFPVLVVPLAKLTAGYSCSSLEFWGDTPPLLSLALPVGILLSFNDLVCSSAAFQKQRHLTIVSASPSMLSLCCISPNVTLFDGLLFKSKNMAILMQQTLVKVGTRDHGTFYSHFHSLVKSYYLFTAAFWPVAQAWLQWSKGKEEEILKAMLVNASHPWSHPFSMSTVLAVILILYLSKAISLVSGLSCIAGWEHTDLLQPSLQFLNFSVYPFYSQLVQYCL